MWVLLRPLLTITSKMQETEPTVYSPYPSCSSSSFMAKNNEAKRK